MCARRDVLGRKADDLPELEDRLAIFFTAILWPRGMRTAAFTPLAATPAETESTATMTLSLTFRLRVRGSAWLGMEWLTGLLLMKARPDGRYQP
jgi:hypothetical protein